MRFTVAQLSLRLAIDGSKYQSSAGTFDPCNGTLVVHKTISWSTCIQPACQVLPEQLLLLTIAGNINYCVLPAEKAHHWQNTIGLREWLPLQQWLCLWVNRVLFFPSTWSGKKMYNLWPALQILVSRKDNFFSFYMPYSAQNIKR